MVQQKINKYPQKIDSTFDLHGLTLAEAEAAVVHFLAQAKGDGLKIVRIITGKGINSPQGQARLKPWLESFLRDKHYPFRSSKISEGGEGSFDIKLP